MADDDHEAALDDVVGMLDLFFVGEFLFKCFGRGVCLMEGLDVLRLL